MLSQSKAWRLQPRADHLICIRTGFGAFDAAAMSHDKLLDIWGYGLWSPGPEACLLVSGAHFGHSAGSASSLACLRRKSGAWLALSILTRIVRCKLSSALGLGATYDPVMQQWDPSKGLQQVG